MKEIINDIMNDRQIWIAVGILVILLISVNATFANQLSNVVITPTTTNINKLQVAGHTVQQEIRGTNTASIGFLYTLEQAPKIVTSDGGQLMSVVEVIQKPGLIIASPYNIAFLVLIGLAVAFLVIIFNKRRNKKKHGVIIADDGNDNKQNKTGGMNG